MGLKNKILFVCMGNICRSPTAEGVFRSIVNENQQFENFDIDSAGTHAYHIGKSPDSRSQLTAKNYGIDISMHRARQIHESDFYYYDFIIAMDIDNFEILKSNYPKESQSKVQLLLDFLPDCKLQSVPDPYYEGKFNEVFELVSSACNSFFESIVKKEQY